MRRDRSKYTKYTKSKYTKGVVWERRRRLDPRPHESPACYADDRIPDRIRTNLGGTGRRHGSCASLDDLAAEADALVHTVIRKDIVTRVPQQQIKDIFDSHSSVEQTAADAVVTQLMHRILTIAA